MMLKNRIYLYMAVAGLLLTAWSCKLPQVAQRTENTTTPAAYGGAGQDTLNSAKIKWKDYFKDPQLAALIDTALVNNQELNITLQEILISRNEIQVRKGEYLPFLGLRAGAGAEKAGRFTNTGTLEENLDIVDGRRNPEPMTEYMFGAYANWEADIWGKLHNAKKAAIQRYLASVEGKNFVVTNMVAEIANSYYELLALDSQLAIVQQNIEIQNNALEIVRLQKQSARATELAVRRFEAQVLHTRSLQYSIQQQIVETENRINFLVGRYPQHVNRSSGNFKDMVPNTVYAGVPAQLLENRPDVRQAELQLAAAKLDVQVAKKQFYPSLGITAGVGYNAFNPSYLIKPESLIYSLAGDLAAPLINRNTIKANYKTANAQQVQAVYDYERTLLNAYIEVANQLSNISNLEQTYTLKSQQVNALNESVDISNTLFRSARADYMEVLLTQRDALESEFDLIETRLKQMNAAVNIYRALGGGWN